jgi:hypothetical protein
VTATSAKLMMLQNTAVPSRVALRTTAWLDKEGTVERQKSGDAISQWSDAGQGHRICRPSVLAPQPARDRPRETASCGVLVTP